MDEKKDLIPTEEAFVEKEQLKEKSAPVANIRCQRDTNGRFLPANQISGKQANVEIHSMQQRLRQHFYNNIKPEHVEQVLASILNMSINCSDQKVRLSAACHYLDRAIGKVKDEVTVELNNNVVTAAPDALIKIKSVLQSLQISTNEE